MKKDKENQKTPRSYTKKTDSEGAKSTEKPVRRNDGEEGYKADGFDEERKARPAYGDKPAYGNKPAYGRKPDGERRPYVRKEGGEGGSFERKPYARKEGGEGGSFERKPYERREGGSFERKPYERREGGSFERKPYERREGGSFERKPYARKEGGEGGSFERKPYERREGGSFERKPYERREGGEGGSFERKPYARREGGSFERKPHERREGGSFERKPYERREGGEGGSFERKPYARKEGGEGGSFERKPYERREGGSFERKPYERREGGSFERKPYERREGGEGGSFERKPYERRESGSFERKPYERREGGSFERKPYERREGGSFERKPYERREGGEGGSFERKPYERRESGSFERKPYERREGGEGGSFERKPYERREGGSFERKPYERREGGEGGSFERKPYERREGGEGGSFERKPYERREGGERGSYSSRPSYGGERSGRSAPRTGGFGGGSGRSYDKKPGGGRPYEGGRGRSGGDFQSKPVGVYEESELITGTLKGNRKGFAFLLREGGDIFIPHSNLRGAMHGDIVKAGITDGDAGEVVEIVERGIKKLAGTFKKGRGGGFVIPDDNSYFTDIYVPADKQKNAKNDLKVVVKIIEYPDSGNPIGEITELLGESGTVEGDITALIRAAGFRENFSTAQVAEAEMASNEPVTLGSRTDFRKLNVITIDGDDAKDFDDAVSVEELPDGGYRLWVHIADVASFVAEGSVLDKEALKRATSVYLPNMVLPMLPEAVSNGCCSLVEGEDRYVLTAIMTLDAGGHVTGSEIAEGVICSAARMTYGNVDKILNGDPDLCNKYKKIKGMLAAMKKLADILNVNRIERGSVEFMSDEAKITVENDKVISVEKYNLGVSNGIIEEFMLLANETVARYMEAEELPFVYRIHGKPDPEKLAGVKELFKNSGVKVMVGNTPKDVQTLLDSIKGEPQEKLLNKVTLRAMQKAKYLGDNTGHFGLALTHYSHFTSPIRRYPDLLCHRLIKNRLHSDGSIDMDISDRWRSIVDERSEISSEREAAAAKLERDANDYFKALFMEDKIGEEYDAEISGVTSFGVFAELPNTVEGLVKISSLAADSYEFSEKEFALKGRKNIYTLGDPIKVRLTGVSISERQCYFEVVE